MMKDIWNFLSKYKVYFQIAISIIIIVFIFNIIDWKDSLSLILQLDLLIIGSILGLSVLKFFIQAINWYYCLKLSDSIDSNFRIALKTHTIAGALRFFLPGGFATFGKVFYIKTQRKMDTLFSIAIEKFYITWGIILFASFSLPLSLYILYDKKMLYLFIITVIVAILPFVITKLFPKRITTEQRKNYNKYVPIFFVTQVIFIPLTLLQYFILLQFFVDYELSFFLVAMVISLIISADIIPITFSGLGLRETASMLLLPLINIPAEIAVATALIIFIFNAIIPAIPGIVLITFNKSHHANTE